MIYKEKPLNFNSKFDVVSCFINYDGKILLLHRQGHKPEGNTWGVPAGKVNKGEQTLKAIIREIQEEAGFKIPSSQIFYFEKIYVKYPKYDFIYHIFHTKLNQKQKVTINHDEHNNYKWVSPEKALNMPLIRNLRDCIILFYKL
ncbi:MAG: NUDIX hydrolase [Nanoarchaeota archaeon]|nr:NUDIX hydrolase [Nanoarchaeota archaeon]MBU1854260.1 NUDIX hydrolase [Nanoarchaeota archaeon]